MTLVEVMVASTILVASSLALSYSLTSSGLAASASERTLAVQASLESVTQSVADVAYDQLLTWNGVRVDRGDHTVTVAANLVRVNLVVLEFTVTDDRTGAVLARYATYRAPES